MTVIPMPCMTFDITAHAALDRELWVHQHALTHQPDLPVLLRFWLFKHITVFYEQWDPSTGRTTIEGAEGVCDSIVWMRVVDKHGDREELCVMLDYGYAFAMSSIVDVRVGSHREPRSTRP